MQFLNAPKPRGAHVVRATTSRRLFGAVSAAALAAGLVGFAGVSSVVLAPGVAMAADECGDPSANGGAADVFVCLPGLYPPIDYTNTNGDLTLILQDGVDIIGGIGVAGDAGERIVIQTSGVDLGAGSLEISNAAGSAIEVSGAGPEVVLNLGSAFPAVAPVIEGQGGVFAVNTAGDLTVQIDGGSILGTTFGGLFAEAEGDVLIELTSGVTVTGQTIGIIGFSNSGNVDLTTTGLVTAVTGDGITLSAAAGDVTAAVGDVQAALGVGVRVDSGGTADLVLTGDVVGQTGVVVDTTGSLANLTLQNGASIEATGPGPYGSTVTATGFGSVNAVIDGAIVSGGLSLSTSSGNIVLTGSGDINNAADSGVEIATTLGFVDVVYSGNIVGADAGLQATMTNGDLDITLDGAVEGVNHGVIMDGDSGGVRLTVGGNGVITGGTGALVTTNDGDLEVNVAGSVTGTTGLEAISGGTGLISVNIAEGGVVGAAPAGGVGLFAAAFGDGDVEIAIDGAVTEGGIRTSSNGAGDIRLDIDATGTVATTGNDAAIDVGTGAGASTVVALGAVSSFGGDGINVSTDSGALSVTTNEAIVAGEDGIEAQSNTGTIVVTTFGSIDAGANGILAGSDGAITINAIADITAGAAVISTTNDGAGLTDIFLAGTGVGLSGISATATDAGAIEIATDDLASITTSAGHGIEAQTVDGALTILNDGEIDATGGSGVEARTLLGGDITIGGTGTIAGSAEYGILARTERGGDITVDYRGDIGSAGDVTAQSGVSAVAAAAVSTISVQVTGDVYTDGGGVFGAGVAGISFADRGSVAVSFQGSTLQSGGTGVIGVIATASNEANVSAGVGAGSSVVAEDSGVFAQTAGSGTALGLVSQGASITAGDYGLLANSADGDATAVVGEGADIVIADVDADTLAIGVAATSGRAADAAADDAAVQILIANGVGITIDNGAGGDADGATGIAGRAFGADASASIQARSVDIAILGNNALGIEASTVGGDILIALDGGAITIAGQDDVDASGNHAQTAGISAISTDGGITISSQADIDVANGALASSGIFAETGGAGAIAAFSSGLISSQGDGIVADNAGAGAISIGSTGSIFAGESAVRVTSNGGAVSVAAGAGSTLAGGGTPASWVIDVANTPAGNSTVTVQAGATVRSVDGVASGYDDNVLRVIGGAATVNNAGRINGVVDFSALTGGAVFNNSGSGVNGWHTTGVSVFSAQADVVSNTGALFTAAGGSATTLDFGAGADVFSNAGVLVAGEEAPGAGTLMLAGLEAWNNSGFILFGATGAAIDGSDGEIGDRILAGGVTFTGSGESRLLMDVDLGDLTQAGCGAPSAADCFALLDGSTAGLTQIRVQDASANAFGAVNEGIVLVDVTGSGVTSAGHLVLDPASDHWRADANSDDGVLDKGLFFYDLVLDGQQHKLIGLPDAETFEFATLGAAAQSVWYSTTGTWFERQADLRGQAHPIEREGGDLWMKMVGGSAERDVTNSFVSAGQTYSFDTSYDQTTAAILGGAEVARQTETGAWILGAQVGYVDSDVNFQSSSTATAIDGASVGVYASYVSTNLFVDAIVNANFLDLDHRAPGLEPLGSELAPSEVTSLGGQIEAGWTLRLGEKGFVEPVASLSYVRTEIGDLPVPGADIVWDDQISLRASVGARLGRNAEHGSFASKWAVTARYWNEFEGENSVVIDALGSDLVVADDFSGSFGEVAGTVGVTSESGALSAFVNLGYRFNDDYQSVDGSLGFRWRW